MSLVDNWESLNKKGVGGRRAGWLSLPRVNRRPATSRLATHLGGNGMVRLSLFVWPLFLRFDTEEWFVTKGLDSNTH